MHSFGLLRPMADPPAPPVEWVKGPPYWWLVRFGPACVSAAVSLGIILPLMFRGGPPSLWLILGVLAVVELGIAIQYLVYRAYPAVRRLGISPTMLFVDIGLTTQSYGWGDVREVARTQVSAYRWNRVMWSVRTRISVGSGITKNVYSLSPMQGERLARFLRIQ
jgi:hypothetical protein